jgi:hypothetical protein
MSKKIESKQSVADHAAQLKAGADKHFTSGSIMLVGTAFTQAEITAKLQQVVDLRAEVNMSKAQTKAKVASEESTMPALRTFMSALVSYVKGAYRGSPDTLADFGIAPKQRTLPTIEAKAGAVAKGKATRAARHTMGPRQKQAVKGDVTGVTLTPVHAPASAVPAPGGQAGPPESPAARSGGPPAGGTTPHGP